MSVAPADAGVRVMLDLRPLQDPGRAPLTAAYLDRLARAFAADPASGERIVPVVRARRTDPLPDLAPGWAGMERHRTLPSSARPGRPVAMTLDGLAQRFAQRGMAGAVYHSASASLPLRSSIPVVATLLDLAPWELPARYARDRSARLGRWLRARGLRSADRVIVASEATREAALELVGLDPGRLAVVPLAGDDAAAPAPVEGPAPGPTGAGIAASLPARYLVVGGRYDARSDLRTVLQALAALRRQPAPPGVRSWPPLVVLTGIDSDPDGPSPVLTLIEHLGVADLVTCTPPLDPPQRAAVAVGSLGHIQPALSDAAGLAALDALAAGVPVVATSVGCLPGIVGGAGILVEPRDVRRMAAAMGTMWQDGPVAAGLRRVARERAGTRRRWSDVAAETRRVYRDVLVARADGGTAGAGPGGPSEDDAA